MLPLLMMRFCVWLLSLVVVAVVCLCRPSFLRNEMMTQVNTRLRNVMTEIRQTIASVKSVLSDLIDLNLSFVYVLISVSFSCVIYLLLDINMALALVLLTFLWP